MYYIFKIYIYTHTHKKTKSKLALHFLKFEGNMFIGQPGFPVVLLFPGQNASKLFFFYDTV